ncbi:MAG: hypothetical protein L3J71_16565 [Victivallaceae bacterium]|nr:hypothetical protein [Victivallaceae bacterium]
MFKMKGFILMIAIAVLLAGNIYGQELLINNSWSNSKGSRPAGWNFATFKGASSIRLTADKFKGQPVAVISSDKLTGRGYIGQRTKLNLPAGKNIIFSGYYRTENIALGPKGMLRVEIKYNRNSKDKKFQAIVLKPSGQWRKFESVKALDVPVKDFFALLVLYRASGKLYFSNLSLKIAESDNKLKQTEKYIWREAEAINKKFTVSAWGSKQPGYFSGKGGVYLQNEPFKWNFKIKDEVDPQTLMPTKRNYFVWLRMYGYMDKPAVSVYFNKNKISAFKTQANEKVKDGKYAGPGKYYWQRAGAFTAAGGTGKLSIVPQGRMLLDAMVVTTDSAYAPQRYEVRNVANKGLFTDIKTAYALKSDFKVYGISDKVVTPLVFRYYGAVTKIPGDQQSAVFHLSLPATVKVKNITSHWAGKSWSRPHLWGNKKLTWQPSGSERIDGIKYNRYKIYLYALSLTYTVFVQAERAGFLPERKLFGHYYLEYKGKKQLTETIPLWTVAMKPVTGFKTILIGPAGGNSNAFYQEFPHIAANMRFSGLNVINAWHLTPNSSGSRWTKFRSQCIKNRITILGEHSPFYGAFMVRDPKFQAVKFTGQRDAQRPSLSVDESNADYRKNLDYLIDQGRQGVTGMVLDDENFNQKKDQFDYNPLTEKLFEKYCLKRGVKYIEAREIVKAKKQYAAQYKAWVDFKCDRMVDRYRKYRQAYLKGFAEAPSSTTFGKKLLIAQILKNSSPEESKINSYWDYKKLAAVCDYISPMIYTYGGIKDSAQVGDLIEMYNRYIGKKVIAPTLLAEHSGFGQVTLSQKKMFKYQILEALMQQSKLILFWKGAAVYNPINLQYISDAIRLVAPYEQIILNGRVYNSVRADQAWVRIKGLKLNNKILLYVANYRNAIDKTVKIIIKEQIRSVVELGLERDITQGGNSFITNFKSDRGKLFLITL